MSNDTPGCLYGHGSALTTAFGATRGPITPVRSSPARAVPC